MAYVPDQYVAHCTEEAGPSPWMHLVRGAITLYNAGFGSKSYKALEGRQAIGSAIVALNGAPLAFHGGMTREPDFRYPGDTRAEVPDALEALARKLDAPDLTEVVNAAFAVMDSDGGDLLAQVAKLGAALDAAFPDRVEADEEEGPELGTLELNAETLAAVYGPAENDEEA